jgi:DNA-binding transcriptional ArsR family regulator
MEFGQALEAFAALSQETRLAILQHLIRRGGGALPAGKIAEDMHIPPSTLSFHVAALERAGLVRSKRNQRQILYSANLSGVRDLLSFLLNDCCGGHPEICANLFPAIALTACSPPAAVEKEKPIAKRSRR